ncbi:SHOCT domain-containing protein [Schumannella luteola]
MITTLALATAALHVGPGFGFGWIFFFLIPLFWIGVVALIVGLGRRRWARAGYGPGWHHGAWAARSAESTLAERFAQGDIDEKEYRARLEVLRASGPVPPTR